MKWNFRKEIQFIIYILYPSAFPAIYCSKHIHFSVLWLLFFIYVCNFVLRSQMHFRCQQNMILTLMLLLLFLLSRVSKRIFRSYKNCFTNNFNNIYMYDKCSQIILVLRNILSSFFVCCVTKCCYINCISIEFFGFWKKKKESALHYCITALIYINITYLI